MEELLKLLNEYEKLNMCRTFIGYYKQEEEITGLYFSIKACELISKKFGFIKWLFDNDKIDKDIVRKKAKYLVLTNGLKYYEWLIMELSIQDNPIEFLISILK